MDWYNIDFELSSERDSFLIEPLTFETLLLEVCCNLPVIDEQTITEQFEVDLQERVDEAREVFRANLKNLTKYAQSQRAE